MRLAPLASPDGRRALVLGWARVRTRISSTEAADLLRLGSQRASQVLNQLKDDGLLVGNRDVMRGRGFAYLPSP